METAHHYPSIKSQPSIQEPIMYQYPPVPLPRVSVAHRRKSREASQRSSFSRSYARPTSSPTLYLPGAKANRICSPTNHHPTALPHMSVARRPQHCKTETLGYREAASILGQPPLETRCAASCCTSSAWQTRSNHWTTRHVASHEGDGRRGCSCTMQLDADHALQQILVQLTAW
jgi:hypothetical protein